MTLCCLFQLYLSADVVEINQFIAFSIIITFAFENLYQLQLQQSKLNLKFIFQKFVQDYLFSQLCFTVQKKTCLGIVIQYLGLFKFELFKLFCLRSKIYFQVLFNFFNLASLTVCFYLIRFSIRLANACQYLLLGLAFPP